MTAQDAKRKLNGQRPCEGKPVVVNQMNDRCASTLPFLAPVLTADMVLNMTILGLFQRCLSCAAISSDEDSL